MFLAQALALPPKGGTVSLVGAGGKTSLMLSLAHQLARGGARVVITTTTHIMAPGPGDCDTLLTDGRTESLAEAVAPGRIICVASRSPDGKLTAPSTGLLRLAADRADWLIVEADGSRRLPIKAPADHEPQVWEPSDVVVAVSGLSALGKPLGQVCHRPVLACALLGAAPETILTPALLARLLTSEEGQFKQVGRAGRFRVLLNQADDTHLAALGEQTAHHIQNLMPGCRVVVSALQQKPSVKGIYHAHCH